MTNIRFIVRLVFIFAVCFAATVPVAPNLQADDCSRPEYIIGDDPPCVPTPPPLYYTVFTDAPNWCPYSYGDWVFERWQNVGGVLTRTGWYVIPYGDTTSHPPSDFPDQYAEDAVGSSCNLIPLPW